MYSKMSQSRASMISSSFRFGNSSSVTFPILSVSAFSSGILNPSAISFVMSFDPMPKVCIEMSEPFSNTEREVVSDPMSTSATPTIFCLSVSMIFAMLTGAAMTSRVSIPARAITPIKSSRCCTE